MDAEHDPIRELRQALRQRRATWELEQTARPRRLISPRSDGRPELGADLRRHLDSVWRQGGPVSRRALRSARAFAVALALELGVVARLTARTAIAALVMCAQVLLILGRRLRSIGESCRTTVARLRRPAPRSVRRESATRKRPATSSVEQRATGSTADDAERQDEQQAARSTADAELQLEAADRRRLEQRVLAVGPDHPDVAVLLQLVAERCAARGASDEALLLYEKALRIQENAFGPDSPALRPLLGDLAELERELGRDDVAIVHESRRRMLERPPVPSVPTDRTQDEGVRGAALVDQAAVRSAARPAGPPQHLIDDRAKGDDPRAGAAHIHDDAQRQVGPRTQAEESHSTQSKSLRSRRKRKRKRGRRS